MKSSDGTSPKRRRRFVVHFDRDSAVQEARMQLPVCMHEQQIMESIHDKDVTVIISSTGSGKTTQVPQFLLEDGFGEEKSQFPGIIAVTQPRRIAAIACASRVAHELNTTVGPVVGFQVRHKSNLGKNAKLKFCTDGILLKEMEADILLSKYSAVVIDEAHERTLNTDLTLSFLSRAIALRKSSSHIGQLRVIIMSATLDPGIFDETHQSRSTLFTNVGIVRIPSRLHPVTVHFSRETRLNYVEAAFEKVMKIHRRLPPGGILVFLSGKDEIELLCKKILEEIGDAKGSSKISVLPLYSMLSDERQQLIFKEVPQGCRKIVVATNIAETSITVPGITYVVDSGKFKQKAWDIGAVSTSSLPVQWISKSSAEQRTGRAGRTGPGHCYRLYSSAVFSNSFEDSSTPEILRVPVDALVLRLRAMGISRIEKFPFLSKPESRTLLSAERLLQHLGAFSTKAQEGNGKEIHASITPTGIMMAKLPVSPRLGRMMMECKGNVSMTVLCCRIAAILSVGCIWYRQGTKYRENHAKHRHIESDVLTDLRALLKVESYLAVLQGSAGNRKILRTVCERVALNSKNVGEALAIASQLEKVFFSNEVSGKSKEKLKPEMESRLLRALLRGFPDQLARRLGSAESAAIGISPKLQKRAFQLPNGNLCLLDSFSSLRILESTEYVMYADVHESSNIPAYAASDPATEGEFEENVLIMRGVSSVDKTWIMECASSHCQYQAISDQTCEAKFDKVNGVVTVTCKVSYGQWPLGRVQRPVTDLIASSRIGDKVLDKCYDTLSRTILTGQVPEVCGNVLHNIRIPKAVAVHRLAEILHTRKAPFSIDDIRKELESGAHYIITALKSWGVKCPTI